MAALITTANWILPLLYLVLLIDYGTTFFLRTKTYARNPLLVVVIGLHALFLVLRGVHDGGPPIASGHEILSIVAFSTALVYCMLELVVKDRRAGLFILLLVFLFQYTSSIFGGHRLDGIAQTDWARLHIIPAVIAYTAFAIGAIYGALHLLAYRNLKHHSVGVFFDRLPPLDLLARMSWYAVLAGFAFMTISIITGPMLVSHAGGAAPASLWDPKIAVKIIAGGAAWLIYGTAIVGKFAGKWSSRTVSVIGVTGFAVTIVMIAASVVLAQ